MRIPRSLPFLLAIMPLGLMMSCTSPALPPNDGQPTLADYNITEVGARTDAAGNDLPADSQPFGSAVATPLTRQQIYLSGPVYAGASSSLIEYKGNVPAALFKQTDASTTSWTANPHASVGARLGASGGPSGKQTMVSVVFVPTSPAITSISLGQKTSGTVKIVTWDGTIQNILTPFKNGGVDKSFDVYMLGWAGAANSAISMAAGDVDKDGYDEIAFCIGNYFVILDHDLSKVLHSSWATADGLVNTDVYTFHPSCVAAGDVKGDGTTQFVVTYGSNATGFVGVYKIFGGAAPTQIATGALSNSARSLNYASVAFGDIDGNGSEELLFAGLYGGSECGLIAADWNASAGNLSWFAKNYSVPGMEASFWTDHPLSPLVAFNPAGLDIKSSDIVLVWRNIVKYDAATGFTQGYGDLIDIPVPLLTNVAAADINYDTQDELITIPSGSNSISIYRLNTSGKFDAPSTVPITLNAAPVLAVADMAGMSLVLQYVSQTVKYANPQVVAVLASPPYYEDAKGNASFGNAATTLGFTNDSESTLATALTVSAGVTFGSDVEVPLLGSTAGAARDTFTIEGSITVAFAETKQKSSTHSYTTMGGQDAVIYTCVPYDVYSYKVLSAPNDASEGAIMEVEFAREPQIIMMDRASFNALPSNKIQIGAETLAHSLGKPTTYPSKATMAAACKDSKDSMYDSGVGMSTSVGTSNYTNDTLSYGSSKSTSIGAGLSATYEAEAVVAGVVFGVSVGLSVNTDYTVTTGSSTEISGTVPSITWLDPGFTYGIGMYRYLNASVQPNPYLVVTYWVGK